MKIAYTYDELKAYAAEKQQMIGISGTIPVKATVLLRQERCTIVGVDERAGLDFTPMQIPKDNPQPWAVTPANGIRFDCMHAHLEGVKLSNFEWDGSCLKGHSTGTFSIENCTFKDVGVRRYAGRVPKPTTLEDLVVTQAIGAHTNVDYFRVNNCTFDHCCTQSHRWAHAVYASGQVMHLSNNTFSKCGNALCLGGNSPGCRIEVVGNTFKDQVEIWSPNSDALEWPYGVVWGIHLERGTFARNMVYGPTWKNVHRIDPGLPLRFEYNTYKAIKVTHGWAVVMGVGQKTKDEWLAMGLEDHATFV